MSNHFTDEEKAQIRKMIEDGCTNRQVAEALGRSRTAIKKHAWKNHLFHKDPEPQFDQDIPELPSLQKLFKLARQNQKVINAVDPIYTHDIITFDKGPIGIIFVSCAHLGGRYTFYKEFEKIFDRVLETPNLYWLSLGDDIEGFYNGFRDTGAVVEQVFAHPKVQQAMLIGVLDKLAASKKLLVGYSGQHGAQWQAARSGTDPIKELFLSYKRPYFDGKGLLYLNIGKQRYEIFGAHKLSGNSKYNAVHAQINAARFDAPNADVVFQGDKHRGAVLRETRSPWEADAEKSDRRYLWALQIGTMKTGPDKYSIRGWSRGVLEWPVLIFDGESHHIDWTDDLNMADTMLRR